MKAGSVRVWAHTRIDGWSTSFVLGRSKTRGEQALVVRLRSTLLSYTTSRPGLNTVSTFCCLLNEKRFLSLLTVHRSWILLCFTSLLSDSSMDGIWVMPHNYGCMAEYDICSRMLLSNTQLNAAKYGWWVWIIVLDRSIIKLQTQLSNWTAKNVFSNFCFLVALFRETKLC